MTTGKRIVITGILLLLGFFIILSAPLAVLKQIDFNSYKPFIQAQVKESFGRTLVIGGDIEFDIGFNSRLKVSDITLSNAPWGSNQTMLSVKHAEAEVSLLPILFGDVHINRLILLEPDLLLETDGDGKGNWQLLSAVDSDNYKSDIKNNNGWQSDALPQVGNVLISKVNVRYKDGISGEQTDVFIESIEAQSESLDAIFDARITGSINKQPIKLSAQLNSLAKLITAQASALEMDIEYGDFKSKISGELLVTPSGYEVDALQLTLNGNLLTGQADYTISNGKPVLNAELYFETLNLNKFHDEKSSHSSKSASPEQDKLFSSEPIDFSVIREIDANVTMAGKEILVSNLALNNLMLTAKLADGLLEFKPFSLGIGESKLQNTLNLDGRGEIALLQMSSKGSGFNLGDILRKTDTTDMLTGAPAIIDISLQAMGNSPAVLASSLSGHILVDIGKGRVNNEHLNLVGGDIISQLLRSLTLSKEKGESYTQLECAVINLQAHDGIIEYDKGVAAETDEMFVISSGIVDLKKETLAIGIAPKPRKDARHLGLSAGGLVSVAQLQGTLKNPKLGLHRANTAKTGAKIYGALMTGGVSLLVGGLWEKITADPHPCQTARKATQSGGKANKKPILEKLFGF